MKNLKKFEDTKLSTEEAQNVKGGIRYNEEMCVALGGDWDGCHCWFD